MKPIAKFAWHFGGLAMMLTGVTVLWGWPAFLIGLGLWAMIGTVIDIALAAARS